MARHEALIEAEGGKIGQEGAHRTLCVPTTLRSPLECGLSRAPIGRHRHFTGKNPTGAHVRDEACANVESLPTCGSQQQNRPDEEPGNTHHKIHRNEAESGSG